MSIYRAPATRIMLIIHRLPGLQMAAEIRRMQVAMANLTICIIQWMVVVHRMVDIRKKLH